MNLVDPTGRSTKVKRLDDGTYEVVDVDTTDDDYNIYVGTVDENGNLDWSNKESIGWSVSFYSFVQDDNLIPMKGAIINPNDNSGREFIQNLTGSLRPLGYYLLNAWNKQLFDFKTTNGNRRVVSDDVLYVYRGMPVLKSTDGVLFYGSARDVGNIVAGYYAAAYGITWDEAREAFDALDPHGPESKVSVYGQQFGYKMGLSIPEQKRRMRRNSFFISTNGLPALLSLKKK